MNHETTHPGAPPRLRPVQLPLRPGIWGTQVLITSRLYARALAWAAYRPGEQTCCVINKLSIKKKGGGIKPHIYRSRNFRTFMSLSKVRACVCVLQWEGASATNSCSTFISFLKRGISKETTHTSTTTPLPDDCWTAGGTLSFSRVSYVHSIN